MNIKEAYDNWSSQYDTNVNKTRDLEALALQQTLAGIEFDTCLEIGCGTGKNTAWLVTKAKNITAVDLSAQMLVKAKEKIKSENVHFMQADILQHWHFTNSKYNLVTFSLMLEHIEDLQLIFSKVADVMAPGGFVYIGELHPFKQYSGSKARFSNDEGEQVVTCFNHHVSDFTDAAKQNGFEIINISEYFDDGNRSNVPRLLCLLLKAVSGK